MILKPKWKVFAVGQCFSTDLTKDEAIKVFDELYQLDDSDDIQEYLDDNDELLQWHPFEDMSPSEFVEQIAALAQHAQDVEAQQ